MNSALFLLLASSLLAAPHDDELIREDDILRRMEREIGLSVRETPAEKKAAEQKAQDTRVFSGKIVLSGGKEMRGEIVLSQKDIVLVSPVLRRVKITSAESLEIVSFRLTAGRYVPARAVIVLKDKSRIEGELRAEDWLSLPVESAGVREELPAFFSMNGGAEEISGPALSSIPPGVPVRIEFQYRPGEAAVDARP